jgi:hypothetical protein
MAYAFVKVGTNSANSNVVTFSPTNAGDFLIVMSDTSAGAGNPTASITDNLSSSWQTARATTGFGAARYLTAFYLPNCPGGITSITLTYNGGTPGTVTIGVFEYSGVATTTPLIVASTFQSQATPGTGVDAIVSPTINVTTQPALLFGVLIDNNNHTSITVGTGFTRRDSGSTLLNQGWMPEDKRVTATGNTTATARDATNGGADTYLNITMAFAESTPPVIALVQKATGNSTQAATFTVALSGVAAGNLLTLNMGALTNASGANSVVFDLPTDTNGTWKFAAQYAGNNTGGTGAVLTGIAYCGNAASGTHTVTIRAAGWSLSTGHATLSEWSNFGTSPSVDVAAFNNATTAQANTAGPTGTTGANVELVLAAVTVKSGAGVANAAISDPPSGFTSLYVQNVTNAGDSAMEHAYLVTAAQGAQSAIYTWTDGTTALSQAVVATLVNGPTGNATQILYRPRAMFVDESLILV